jgi:hypothetical protein
MSTTMGERMNTAVFAFNIKSQQNTAFEIHKWVYSDFKLNEQDIIVIQIHAIRRQMYRKFGDLQKAVDI